jgi:hypothetical protein
MVVVAAMAEEMVNDPKNRLASSDGETSPAHLRPRPPWQLSGPDPHRLAKYERARGPCHLHHLPHPSTALAATVRNLLERLVRAAAPTGLMAGLA